MTHGLITRDYRMGRATCRVYNNANQIIPTGAFTALTFNMEHWDPDGMHNPAVNPTRITITSDGKYVFVVHASWATSGLGTSRQCYITLNGAVSWSLYLMPPSAVTSLYYDTATILELVVGDFVEAVVWQNTGGNLNANAGAHFALQFECHRLS